MNSNSGKRRNLVLITCCGIHGLQDGLVATLYVLLPVLAQTFGLSYAQVGIVRAANNSAMMLFEIPAGMLSERLGEWRLLVFGLACAGAAYLWLAAADGFAIIVFSLLLAGFGAAFQHSLASSLISQTFRSAGRRAALGAYNSSGDVGKLIFTGLFSLAIGMGAAWQGIVVGYGMTALLVALVLFIVLRRLGAGKPPRLGTDKGGAAGRLGWGIRDRAGFTALALIVFLDITVQSGFLTFLSFLMIDKQVPTGLAAFAVVLTLVGGVFGKFGCGFLAERIGVIRSLIVVEGITAAGIVAVLLSPVLAAYCLLPVLGLALQGSSTITYGVVGDLVHADRQSRGFAAVYTIASGASVIGPIAYGFIGDQFGLTVSMLAMACVVLLVLPLSMLLRPALAGKYA